MNDSESVSIGEVEALRSEIQVSHPGLLEFAEAIPHLGGVDLSPSGVSSISEGYFKRLFPAKNKDYAILTIAPNQLRDFGVWGDLLIRPKENSAAFCKRAQSILDESRHFRDFDRFGRDLAIHQQIALEIHMRLLLGNSSKGLLPQITSFSASDSDGNIDTTAVFGMDAETIDLDRDSLESGLARLRAVGVGGQIYIGMERIPQEVFVRAEHETPAISVLQMGGSEQEMLSVVAAQLDLIKTMYEHGITMIDKPQWLLRNDGVHGWRPKIADFGVIHNILTANQESPVSAGLLPDSWRRYEADVIQGFGDVTSQAYQVVRGVSESVFPGSSRLAATLDAMRTFGKLQKYHFRTLNNPSDALAIVRSIIVPDNVHEPSLESIADWRIAYRDVDPSVEAGVGQVFDSIAEAIPKITDNLLEAQQSGNPQQLVGELDSLINSL